jgi:hypothetical protein
MNEKEITQNFLMKEILDEIKSLQSNMPSGDIKIMQTVMEDVKKDQKALKDDMSDIKKKLLDPDDGVIVKVNQNTKFRLQEEDRYDDYMQFNIDMNDLKKWKEGVNKALWIIFAAIIAIALKLLFGAGSD